MTETDGANYREAGSVFLPGLFPAEVTTAFYSRLAADADLQNSSGRYFQQGPLLSRPAIEIYSHIYPPMATFLWALTPAMTVLAGEALLPTYAYFRAYQGGDVCRVHADRHACEHSLSLTLIAADGLPWALSVGAERRDRPSADVTADFGEEAYVSYPMNAGDAVAYAGVAHRHGRLEGNPNAWSAHLFMHWVAAAGPHADQAFDRPALMKAGQV